MHIEYVSGSSDRAAVFHFATDADLVSFPVIATVLALVLAYWLYSRSSSEDESAVEFKVDVPEQCREGWLEKAEVLEAPSIQVRFGVLQLRRTSLTSKHRFQDLQPYNATVLLMANSSAASIPPQQKASIEQ